ncbi:multidrug effflux MFS transporter [Nakamurella flavida]|uniref:Multidrug effflux MFS transporter n=1 Tax=Nakamurella flavida TaxID=363630 RepID=A0A939C576_9ACTN|nr:multidrug effflux MFS transporter [Nakamurella flavida]MBM9475922.1 multidrug effflux MFS transporter [Nakamurella flavida]MBM9478418.1 multidrug effflux MFS transporter [Nakamurella flavida]
MLLAVGALSGFGPLCLDMYLPALPELPGDLGSTAGAAQLTLSACIVGLALGQLLVGPVSDAVGRRGPLLVGVTVFAAASAVCALTTSMTVLIAARFVQGAAGAAGIVVGRAVVADLFVGRAAASAFATVAAVNGLAPVLAPLIGGQVLRVGDWRTVFWVLAGLGLVLLALAAALIPESLPRERRGGRTGTLAAFRVLLADRAYLGCVLAGTMVSAAMFGYISASPFLFQEGFGLSPQAFSWTFALNAVGIVLATQIGRVALRRVGPASILAAGIAQAAVGAAALTVAVLAGWGVVAVAVALFVMVSAVGLALPNASALALARHREIAGSASALFGLTQFALAAVTAPLVGLGDRAAGTALAVTAVVCVLLGAGAFLLARRAEARTG